MTDRREGNPINARLDGTLRNVVRRVEKWGVYRNTVLHYPLEGDVYVCSRR